MSFEEWLSLGIEKGWMSEMTCYTHDGTPMTEEESEDDEPCIAIARMYGPEGPPEDVG